MPTVFPSSQLSVASRLYAERETNLTLERLRAPTQAIPGSSYAKMGVAEARNGVSEVPRVIDAKTLDALIDYRLALLSGALTVDDTDITVDQTDITADQTIA